MQLNYQDILLRSSRKIHPGVDPASTKGPDNDIGERNNDPA